MSGALLAVVSGWIEIVLDKTSGAPAATRPVEAGDAKFAKEQTASRRTGEKERGEKGSHTRMEISGER